MVAKWIATDSKACFFLVTPSSLLTKFYGETEMTIKALFLIAEKYAPTVLFIDEIDALFGKRDERDQEANIRMKNELLQGMDGANASLKQTVRPLLFKSILAVLR
jgi:SpoVK/Ycf46/Vps4 family AAA+-type ATPase